MAQHHHHQTPGMAGFLEMEQDPSQQQRQQEGDLLGLGQHTQHHPEEAAIRTTSGLLLTHRKTHAMSSRTTRSAPSSSSSSSSSSSFHQIPGTRVGLNPPTHNYPQHHFHHDLPHFDDEPRSRNSMPSRSSLEFDHRYSAPSSAYPTASSSFWSDSPYSSSGSSLTMVRTKRLLRMVRFWLIFFGLVLFLGTSMVFRNMKHESNTTSSTTESKSNTVASMTNGTSTTKEQIFLIPFPNATLTTQPPPKGRTLKRVVQPLDALPNPTVDSVKRTLASLQREFHEWMATHQKEYASEEEKDKRFGIWTENHHRTIAKNERHGPCKLTGEPVFGSNHFKDLSPSEFQSHYLTGYKGPRHDDLLRLQQRSRHHLLTTDELFRRQSTTPVYMASSSTAAAPHYMSISGCAWTDVSCWLRWLAKKFLYGIGSTLVPNGSYPDSIDWRDANAVTQVHSQGNCGACWAITAVETVESAYAMKKGALVDLEESEVILCDDTCEMCEGGWPQNAYDYIMEHNGLPLEDNWSYDGDVLLELSMIKTGESNYDESYLESYQQSYCPSGGGSHSGDNSGSSYTSAARYGSISGYGYATDRCVCYSDGTGCDCDEQSEKLALRNMASYGPATVCLEASTWQDYAGGIMTSDIGCSPGFLDMNHCVQAVGYAFMDLDDTDTEGQQQGSGSGSGSQGSQDDGNRQGYWIVRNQWSSNWGINGYAYVAMGDNTCGILNDMTQAYM